jgi:integrase
MIRLPGSRVKRMPRQAQVGHEIPLSRAAMAVLAQCPRPAGAVYVFSVTDGRSPVADWDRSKVLKQFREDVAARRAAAGRAPVEPFVLHDLRRTAVVGMQALGVPFDVIEAVVGHVGESRRGVAGVYRRFPYANEKAEALERWGQHIMALLAKPIIRRKRLSAEAAAALGE